MSIETLGDLKQNINVTISKLGTRNIFILQASDEDQDEASFCSTKTDLVNAIITRFKS